MSKREEMIYIASENPIAIKKDDNHAPYVMALELIASGQLKLVEQDAQYIVVCANDSDIRTAAKHEQEASDIATARRIVETIDEILQARQHDDDESEG